DESDRAARSDVHADRTAGDPERRRDRIRVRGREDARARNGLGRRGVEAQLVLVLTPPTAGKLQRKVPIVSAFLRAALAGCLAASTSPQAAGPGEPPVTPVGLDAYRQWDRWAYQRIGARAYMRSTYDRAGGNEGADASHFLYQQADDFNVTLDVQGPGV